MKADAEHQERTHGFGARILSLIRYPSPVSGVKASAPRRVSGQFHDQPFGQQLERTIIFLLEQDMANRLTTGGDDGASPGDRRRLLART